MTSSANRFILWVLSMNWLPEILGRNQMASSRDSIIGLNIEGESGQPWRVPFMIRKQSDSMFVVKAYAEGCVCNVKMADRMVLQKHIF